MHDDIFIAANWKMNLDVQKSAALAASLREGVSSLRTKRPLTIALCPSFDSLTIVRDAIKGTALKLGAQDVFWQDKGAYTGEISASMLRAAGCSYIIIGHSERRRYLNENDEMVNRKVRAALSGGLTPIICVGETFDERNTGLTDHVLMRQVIEGLRGISFNEKDSIIIAYEPVWVIGSGQAIDPAAAERAAQIIRQSLIDLLPLSVVQEQTRIIYGGSVSDQNIRDYVGTDLLEGALVGGASLSSRKFINLVSSL